MGTNFHDDGCLYGFNARARWLCEMERIIAKHCSTDNYQSNSYRFPVHYWQHGELWKAKGLANVDYNNLDTMYYKFGVHRLNIGKALLEIMDFIEEKYDSECLGFGIFGDD